MHTNNSMSVFQEKMIGAYIRGASPTSGLGRNGSLGDEQTRE